MVVIYFYLERDNDKLSKFCMSDSFYIETNVSLF